MIPAVLAGLAVGPVFLEAVSDVVARRVIGAILLAVVALTLWRRYHAARRLPGEVGCVVDADGVHPWPIAPVEGEMLGLMASVKAAERHVITAATTGSREHAWRAFAAHPLVDSVAVARSLLDTYSERFEAIGRLLS